MPRSSDQPGPSTPSGGEGPRSFKLTRRGAIAGAGAVMLGAGATAEHLLDRDAPTPAGAGAERRPVPFHGVHQAGIATPQQAHLYFASFDVNVRSPGALKELLREWSLAAAALTAGDPYAGPSPTAGTPSDTGEAVGLGPSRLTLTLGVGPTLFAKTSLSNRRPSRLETLPPFQGELLDPASSGGDLCVQACAEDPQVAFHALHALARIGGGDVALRWSQTGFVSAPASGTPRNLVGFKDGTNNLRSADTALLERFVWVQPGDGPAWLTGGSYMIVRRIEIVFPTWDQTSEVDQEHAIGRRKASGAPLGAGHEHDPVDLSARDPGGALAIPAHAHIRLAGPASNGGLRMLRRGYSYSRGFTAGPADRGGHQLDGGLLFIAYVRDPAHFITIQRRLAAGDALSAFTVHRASAIFACPPGAARGGFVGQSLFD